jgi:hypothetical protein
VSTENWVGIVVGAFLLLVGLIVLAQLDMKARGERIPDLP